MNNLKGLVEKIIEYTLNWSITENEWYWNIACMRKSENINEKNITDKEFQVAIREEILYDLVYKNGVGIKNQIENDLCNYEDPNLIRDVNLLEKEIKKYIKEFKINY